MKIRAVLLLFLFIAAPTWAAGLLGRTYDECVAQFGAAAKHEETGSKIVSDMWTFQQGEWTIEVGVWKGIVHLVTYKRTDGKPLTAEQTKALLAGFGNSYGWTADPSGSYRRADKLVKAKPGSNSLTFLTTELARAL